MAKHKKQHFLAQSYLKGFSPGDIHGVPQIWKANNKKKVIKLGSIKKSAQRSFFYSREIAEDEYDHTIENKFSFVEAKYPKLREKIHQAIKATYLGSTIPNFTLSDQLLICEYIFIHMSRIPKMMDWMKQEAELYNSDMKKRGFAESIESSAHNLSVKSLSVFLDNNLEEGIEILKNKNMKIQFMARRKQSFLTCDNPVIVFRQDGGSGIIHDNSQIIFPLSSRAIVRLYNRGHQLAFEKLHDLEVAEIINYNIIKNATNEVFGNDPERIMIHFDRSWNVERRNDLIIEKNPKK